MAGTEHGKLGSWRQCHDPFLKEFQMHAVRAVWCHRRGLAAFTAVAMLVLFVPSTGATASARRPALHEAVTNAAPRHAAVRMTTTPHVVRPASQGSGTAPAASPTQVAYSLTRDSDGQVPAKGDSVTLMFAGQGVAWFLATSSGGDLSYQGTWTYGGGKISLSFTANGFTRKGTFPADLGASSIVIPFQAFSAKPGTSTWAETATDPAGGAEAVVLAAAEASANGLTTDQIVTTAAQYVSSMTGAPISAGPGFSSISGGSSTSSSSDAALYTTTPRLSSVGAFRSRHSLAPEAPGGTARLAPLARSADSFWNSDGVGVTGVIELSDAILLQLTNTRTVTVILVPNTVGGSGAALKQGPFASDPRTDLVPQAPGIATDDPPVKKAFFWEPFNAMIIRTWTSSDGTHLSATTTGLSQFYHFDQEQTMLEDDGYQVLRATDGGATVAKLIQDLSGSTPGLIFLNSHGGSNGILLSGDDLGTALGPAWLAFYALQKKLSDTYGMPPKDISLGAAPVEAAPSCGGGGCPASAAPEQVVYDAAINPAFWSWLRTKHGADFSHSLVFVSACETDQAEALRNAFEARAYFAFMWTTTAELAGAVEFYLITEITRPTVTAEEAYYNMLRIDTSGLEAYSFDSILNGVFSAQQKNNPAGVSAGIYRVLNAYGWNGSTMVPYVGNGWLTTGLDEGEIWTMLWAARWGRDTKQGVANLEGCYTSLWSHFELGGITSTCQQWTDGNVPTKNEYDYVIYLLTGKDLGFSHTLVPRFTANDGR
jgi:hypothetical protein